MSRELLQEQLAAHRPWDDREAAMTLDMRRFVDANPDCFSRSLAEGHITGSAWILDAEGRAVLLVHHGRLDRWLQPGGHCEPGETALETAVREAREETGIGGLELLAGGIFDIDVHPIPARGAEPEHLHYDVRYAFIAGSGAKPVVSAESREVLWVDLARVRELNPEASVMRMVQKTQSFGFANRTSKHTA